MRCSILLILAIENGFMHVRPLKEKKKTMPIDGDETNSSQWIAASHHPKQD